MHTGMRIGHGYDTHPLVTGRKLILGGVEIPYERGLAGHSDADALTHALCDALLGAAALGDIGRHFPDSDSQFKDMDSRILLRQVHTLLLEQGYTLINADLTIIAQAPRMAPHVAAMRANIGSDLAVSDSAINIKASTTEGMGYLGRGEGISVHAVVLLSVGMRNT